MDDCLFCKIAKGDIPGEIVHQDDDLLVFKDIGPVAPHHLLVIPRTHIADANGLKDTALAGKLFMAATTAAKELGVSDSGYRIVINTGADGGQLVKHLHLHVIAGRQMKWPPG